MTIAEQVTEKALKLILDDINGIKRGKPAPEAIKIGYLGDMRPLDVAVIPTGALSLDLALGVGGMPKGRIIEIFGPESSGKTTLLLHQIVEAQKLGLTCAFIDVEHTLDLAYAKALGVNPAKLLFSQPDNGDEAMRIVDKLASSGQVAIIALDSVASLTTEAEMEKEITDNNIGLQARLMSQALRRLTVTCGKTGTIILFTNQIRMKIGVMYGNPETTPGGNALKFYASVRLDIRRQEPIKDGDQVIGTMTRVKVVKNKVAPPFKEAHFRIMYGQGIDKAADVVNTAADLGIIERAGAWYSYKGERVGQGIEAAMATILEKPELVEDIRKEVLTKACSRQARDLEEKGNV